MYIALRLLRDGAHTTITTRFPNDAVRRFAAMPDSADWLHRLRIVGIDLRDPAQVVALADDVARRARSTSSSTTPRRPCAAPRRLRAARRGRARAAARTGRCRRWSPSLERSAHPGGAALPASKLALARRTTALALTDGSLAGPHDRGHRIDAGGLVPDLTHVNSWTQRVDEVDALELLEVQLCNTTAPFILISRLRPALAASRAAHLRRQRLGDGGPVRRGYKGPGHPHTNMAKAALNMLTRTSAQEMLETDGILMTERRHRLDHRRAPAPDEGARLADEGFHAPLDLVDGAAAGLRPDRARRGRARTSTAAS
jgi:NAD(P)-dependent dehydrogenase (short-subunit alcohol dehydrogenase family)